MHVSNLLCTPLLHPLSCQVGLAVKTILDNVEDG